jgi:hypothetical protein
MEDARDRGQKSLYFASVLEVSRMQRLLLAITFVLALAGAAVTAVAAPADAPRLVRWSGAKPILLEPSSRIVVRQGVQLRLGIENVVSTKYHEITWYKNDQLIPGATGPVLVLDAVEDFSSGMYTASLKTPCAVRRTAPVVVAVEEAGNGITSTSLIEGYRLEAIQPNPVADKATIRFSVPAPCKVTLKVVDVVGNAVATILSADVPAGTHTSEFVVGNADIASTLYYVVLSTQGFKTSRPMMVVK